MNVSFFVKVNSLPVLSHSSVRIFHLTVFLYIFCARYPFYTKLCCKNVSRYIVTTHQLGISHESAKLRIDGQRCLLFRLFSRETLSSWLWRPWSHPPAPSSCTLKTAWSFSTHRWEARKRSWRLVSMKASWTVGGGILHRAHTSASPRMRKRPSGISPSMYLMSLVYIVVFCIFLSCVCFLFESI